MNVVEYFKGMPRRMAEDLANLLDRLDSIRWELGLNDEDVTKILLSVVLVCGITYVGILRGADLSQAFVVAVFMTGFIMLWDWAGGMDYVEP